LANIASAKKRNRQNEKRRLRNRVYRGRARTFISQARTAIMANDENVEEKVRQAISALDRAAVNGVIHRNNAARRKSRLMKLLAKHKQQQA
jgi:small subunit ribosomal protein S20